MFIFGNDRKSRGCFNIFDITTSGGHGAILSVPQGTYGNWPSGTGGPTTADHVVITGLSWGQKEKYHTVQCFSDHAYVYAFGHDALNSVLEVNFVGFLVDTSGTNNSGIVPAFNKMYKDNRVYASPTWVTVSLGATVMKGLLVGMSSATLDPLHNLQNFTAVISLVEAQ